jgi:hypothetical protein
LTLRLREAIAVVAFFAVLTCALTHPQLLSMGTHTGMHYDTLFSIWRLAWIAHTLPRNPAGLFDANIFAPEKSALAYSDAMLFQGLIAAPLIWAGIDVVTAYNILVLLSFVTAGAAMYWLVRRLTGSSAIGVVGGLMYAFQPYRYAHYPQLELLWTCWIPIAFVALHEVFERHRIRDGLLLGAAVGLQVWSCLYYALFLVTALATMGLISLCWLSWQQIRRVGAPIAVAVTVAAALSLPYALPYLEVRAATGPRTVEELKGWSPRPDNYLSTNAGNKFSERFPRQVGYIEGVLFPGSVAIALALVAMIASWKRHARIVLPYVVTLIVSFDLSLGSNGFLFETARALLPPYQSLRVSGRMFVIVLACLIVLAGYGAAWLFDRIRPPRRRWIALLLGGAVIAETFSVPMALREVPERSRVYRWLALQEPTTILEWPVPEPDNLGDTHEPEYMYFSIGHWHRLANGYSGLYTDNYIKLLEVLRDFPNRQSLFYVRRRGIRYIVLHSSYAPRLYPEVMARLKAAPEVEFLMADGPPENEVAVFRVRGV